MGALVPLILNALKSWKTTILGAIPGAAVMWTQFTNLTDNDPATVFSPSALVGGLALALAFFAAKDSTVTGVVK